MRPSTVEMSCQPVTVKGHTISSWNVNWNGPALTTADCLFSKTCSRRASWEWMCISVCPCCCIDMLMLRWLFWKWRRWVRDGILLLQFSVSNQQGGRWSLSAYSCLVEMSTSLWHIWYWFSSLLISFTPRLYEDVHWFLHVSLGRRQFQSLVVLLYCESASLASFLRVLM